MDECNYCNNKATRNAHNPHKEPTNDIDLVCEIHYAYLKPDLAKVNPLEVGRCMRCGQKSLNKRGDSERLIEHHVNYYLDLTVPVCDSCHQEIHGETPDDMYLEATERKDEPYTPRGSKWQTGVGIHTGYKMDGGRQDKFTCPNCGTKLLPAPAEMGFEKPLLCDNSECSRTVLDTLEADG